MSPFLKALIGWNILSTKGIREKIHLFFSKKDEKEQKEIDLAIECSQKSIVDITPSSSFTADANLRIQKCSHLDEKTARLRNFFSENTQDSKIYYKLWTSKRANRLPLAILTSFRILICSSFIVTVVHKFLSENPKLTFLLLLLTIYFLSRSRWLLDRYLKIEAQFLQNLKGNKNQEEGL